MRDSIATSFEYAGGNLDVQLKFNPNGSLVTFSKTFNGSLEEIILEEATGNCVDIPKDWIVLSGAALKAAQQKLAKECGIEVLGDYLMLKGLEA